MENVELAVVLLICIVMFCVVGGIVLLIWFCKILGKIMRWIRAKDNELSNKIEHLDGP